MRRLIAVMLVLMMLLCSCSVLVENNKTSDLPQLESHFVLGSGSPLVVKPALYFTDSRTGKLAAEVRDIVVPDDMSVEEVIVEKLR